MPLSSFSTFSLTRLAMKNVIGGTCRILYDIDNCATQYAVWYPGDMSASKNQANNKMGHYIPGVGTVTGWQITECA